MSFGQISKDALTSCKLHSHHSPTSFLILDARVESEMAWSKERNEGTSTRDKSIIIQSGSHYLCLNFMLFKLFIGRKKLL